MEAGEESVFFVMARKGTSNPLLKHCRHFLFGRALMDWMLFQHVASQFYIVAEPEALFPLKGYAPQRLSSLVPKVNILDKKIT